MNSSVNSETLPTVADIEAAAVRIAGQAIETPLLEFPALNERTGGRIFIKPEQLQRTGSFKFRGAFNKLKRLAEAGGSPGGVVAFSSGNHAQGVAAAAQLMNVPAVIVMPADAPAIKIGNTRGYGAEVVFYDRDKEDREAIADDLATRRGAAIVRPFDDPDIIAGQGTTGREIARQAKAAGADLDAALLPCGGGGLIAGSALALRAVWPELPVYACEPAGFDDTLRSLAAHQRLGVKPGAQSICDGLLSPMPGRLTFALNQRLLAGGISLDDSEVLSAMEFAFRVLKLVVEPSGAMALAAILSGKFDCRGRSVALVCSGGNVDPGIFARSLTPGR
ncbi:MAG: threonine dehydratase [Rhodospirillaceae bacterium]|jgi:threonine dehydratase|nr:threonine dehydratase [Rhodospirillaceae bacterium]